MTTDSELEEELRAAAMACANAAARAVEASSVAAFGDDPDWNAASALAVWANQASNTCRELTAAFVALRSTP